MIKNEFTHTEGKKSRCCATWDGLEIIENTAAIPAL